MRLTNLYVEAAGHLSGNQLRVNQQYLSVLFYPTPPEEESVTDNMTITDSATVQSIVNRSVADSLGVSDSVVVTGDRNVSVADTLSLVQVAQRAQLVEASSNLGLVDYVGYFNYIDDKKHTGDTLNLIQSVISLSAVPAEHTLNLVSTANGYGPYRLLVTHFLGLAQRLPTPFFIDVSHDLGLSSILYTPISASGTDTLNLTDVASMTFIVDTLNMVQIATAAKDIQVEQTINIQQTIWVEGNWIRHPSHTLNLGHALTWFEDTPCFRKQYTPFQGENTVFTIFAQPPATLPISHGDASTDRLVLYYPSHSVIAKQLVLRAPELDNRDRNAYTRVSRETRGGSLIVYADPAWPSLRTLVVSVVGLTALEAEAYMEFIEATLGKQIEIRDWEGRLWQGIIINPENPVVQDGKERFTIAFDFEGEAFEEELPETLNDGFNLGLTDEASCEIV